MAFNALHIVHIINSERSKRFYLSSWHSGFYQSFVG